MGPVLDASEENLPDNPRLLATLADHFGPVNVVRFSSDGSFVASGSDDNLVCIHEHKPGPGCAALFGSSDSPNHENWAQAMSLRGHSSNVTGLTWSPDGAMLASCSLDNTVIVWDAVSGGRIATLSAHQSCVKGVAWDPIGRYLASQADDKSVVFWKAEDWSQVARVESCFSESSTSTFTLRPSWTVDGSTLMTPNVAEPPCQCAAAIDRGNWMSDFKLVGHRAPVVACAVNPKLFLANKDANGSGEAANGDEGGADEAAEVSHCVALGSQDQRLSVWLTSKAQPVLIAKTVFEGGVNDLAWTPDGLSLVACSIDGTIAVFTFTEAELGKPLPKEQVDDLLANLYGEAPGMRRTAKFVESVAQLELEAAARSPVGAAVTPPSGQIAVQSAAKQQKAPQQRRGPKTMSPRTKQPQKHPLQQSSLSNTAVVQVESRTKDGRRRVNPVQMDSSGSPLARSSLLQSATNAFAAASTAPGAPSSLMPPPAPRPVATGAHQRPQQDGNGSPAGVWLPGPGGNHVTGLQPPPLLPGLEADLPPPALSARASGSASTSSELASVRLAARAGGGALGASHPVGAVRAVVAVSNKKAGSFAATLSCCTNRQGPAVEASPSPSWSLALASPCLILAAGDKLVSAALADGSLLVLSPGGRQLLPPLALGSPAAHIKIFGWRLLVAAGASIRLWDVRQEELIADADLGPMFALAGSSGHIVDLDLSPRGEPVVILSNRQAFVYHTGMRSWMRVADDRFPSSPFHASFAGPHGSCRGALASLHQHSARSPISAALRSPGSLLRGGGGSHQQHREATAHLERCIASAAVLGDAEGLRRGLRIHSRQLAEAGDEDRLRDLFTDLLGPVELGCPGSEIGPHDEACDGSPWVPSMLGIKKIDLLREILPMVAATRLAPGLVGEFQDLLQDLEAGRAALPDPMPRLPPAQVAGGSGPRAADTLGKRRRVDGE